MRHHVGGHMLQREELRKRDFCGFCARSGQCRSSIQPPTKRNGVGIVLSNCRYAPRADMRSEVVQLRLSSAKVSRTSTACTNLPMLCKFCEQPQYVWKYGMADHVAAEHKFNLLQNDNDAEVFAQESTVSQEEKLVLAAFEESSKPKSGGGRGRPLKTAHKTARRLSGNQQHGRR